VVWLGNYDKLFALYVSLEELESNRIEASETMVNVGRIQHVYDASIHHLAHENKLATGPELVSSPFFLLS
jgi:hypothetical protein